MRTKLLTLLLCLLTTLPALAFDIQIGGICYNFTSNSTVEVTKYNDNGSYRGSITIPAVVQYDGKTYSVTGIGGSAFQDCTGLTSIILPNSITAIGGIAGMGVSGGSFAGCTNLTSITLPDSLVDMGNETFTGCTSLTSITLPNSLTSIGNRTFEDCTSLTSITLPNSITYISSSAFYRCTGLTSITLSNSITDIGIGAFYGCTGLTSITFPNSITYIASEAFKGCTGLKEIYCEAEELPTCRNDTFYNVDYANCTLYVPTVAVEYYRQTYPWSRFNIVGYDFAGMAEVSSVSPAVAYDLQGRRVSNPRRGIFIVNGQKQRLN